MLEFLDGSIQRERSLARGILAEVMRFRRISGPQTACATSACEECLKPHLSRVVSAIVKHEPITFVLPAFPGKSPNLAKVLGVLPDMAERQALEFLQDLCDRIRARYSPGARIILCSDGRVFSDVIGIRDEDVTAYQQELSNIIDELGLISISTVNLEDLYENLSFDQMREQLMASYGEPLEVLQASVSRGGKPQEASADDIETNRLYCGITRFLVEDSMFPGQTQSRTSIQKECRKRAYEVIRRSKAWSDWIEKQFSKAIRLSIHPQSCGAKKLGIRLSEFALSSDNWQTPWHAVAVEIDGRFMLLKRSQAETLGARLVHRNGRASHYVLTEEKVLSLVEEGRYGA